MYPSSSPANIGTSALARIVIISIGLFFRPLGFDHSADQNRRFSCLRFPSTAIGSEDQRGYYGRL
jgi:hypothetical protein